MCTFVALLVPKPCEAAAKAILQTHRSFVSTIQNEDLTKATPISAVQLIAPKRGCDCATVLARGLANEKFDHERFIARARRKRWSDAKIERSIADKENGMASSTHPGSDTFEEWGAIVSELLENCGDWLGVFVHQYRGSLDDEKLSAVARRVPATLSIGEALRDLDEDELLYFDQAWLRAQA